MQTPTASQLVPDRAEAFGVAIAEFIRVLVRIVIGHCCPQSVCERKQRI
jgi:hypothetical protein